MIIMEEYYFMLKTTYHKKEDMTLNFKEQKTSG